MGALQRGGSRVMCNMGRLVQGARCNVQCARRKSAARNWASGEDWALGGVGEHVAEQILRIALATTGNMFFITSTGMLGFSSDFNGANS